MKEDDVELLFPPRELEKFRAALIQWFREEGRSYPWRETRDPYAILVSELMLQQTQVQTVLDRGYFENWMEKFPDLAALAAASEEEILRAWEGLGYYNRARNLQKAAKTVLTRHGGEFPTDFDDLLALPGVGPYTAGAVFSFAFGNRAPIVDGNVVRVLTRLFSYPDPVDRPAGMKRLWQWAEAMTPEKEVREYNSGIMELGQRICRRTHPKCEECPVEPWCLSRRAGNPGEFPVKAGKRSITNKTEHVLLMMRNDDTEVFLTQEKGARRTGLWRLPEIAAESVGDLPACLEMKYSITRFRVELLVYRSESDPDGRISEKGAWFPASSIHGKLPPMGAPYRKALAYFMESE